MLLLAVVVEPGKTYHDLLSDFGLRVPVSNLTSYIHILFQLFHTINLLLFFACYLFVLSIIIRLCGLDNLFLPFSHQVDC